MADGFKALPCMGRAFYMQFNAQISVMAAILLCFIVRHTCLNCAVYEKDHPVMQYCAVERAGHNLQIEQPEIFVNLVKNWLLTH